MKHDELLRRKKFLEERLREIKEKMLKKLITEKREKEEKPQIKRPRHEEMKPYTDARGISYVWDKEIMNYVPQVKVIDYRKPSKDQKGQK